MCHQKNILKKYNFVGADMHLGGRLTKMAVICQRLVIWLQRDVDMIA